MSEIKFSVDETKCIHCGLCTKDCISEAIKMGEDNKPYLDNAARCIKCQHCLAICPTGALSILDKKPDESDRIYSQDPEMILNLIKSRRSQRLYKKENVSPEIMKKLKDMLAYIPTGCNYHKLHFSFIDDVEVMDEFRSYVNNKILAALTSKPIKAIAQKFSKYLDKFIKGEDVIFRGAPHLLVVSNPITAPCAKEDAIIALSYFELYAASLEIGTCWCGFSQMCFRMFPELSEYMKIPTGYKPQYVILFGPKEAKYLRTIQPENYEIVSAQKVGFKKQTFFDRLKALFNRR